MKRWLLALAAGALCLGLAPPPGPLVWHFPTDGSGPGTRFLASEGFEPSAVRLHMRWETSLQYRAQVVTGAFASEFGFLDGYDALSFRLWWAGGTLAEGEHGTAYHDAALVLPGSVYASEKYPQASAHEFVLTDPQVLGALGETAGLNLSVSVWDAASAQHVGGPVVWEAEMERRLVVEAEVVP